MVSDRLFAAVVSSTAILSAIIGAIATWLVFSRKNKRPSITPQDVDVPNISDVPGALQQSSPDAAITSNNSIPFADTVAYLSNTNDWTPQPRKFSRKEWDLFRDFRSSYIVERFGNLRSALRNFVCNVTWSPLPEVLDLRRILDTHEYPYSAHELVQLSRLVARLTDDSNREDALTALLSWIIFTNISLHGSPSWTLLSPTLIATAQAIDGNNLDEYGCWAWEKARVYMCFLLCQSPIHAYPALGDDLDQPINPGALDRLTTLLQDLLNPFIKIDDPQLLELKRCLDIASRVGFGMQRDLRPWRFSFAAHHVTKETRLNGMATVGGSRELAPFSATAYSETEDFVSDRQV